MREKGDYPYKFLEDSRENNINGLNNILHDTDVDLSWNNMLRSTIKTLPLFNLNTFKPIDTLYDLRNNNVELNAQSNTHTKFDDKRDYKPAEDVPQSVYSKFLHRNPLSKTANHHIEQLRRYRNDKNLTRSNNSIKFGKLTYSNQWKHNTRGLDTYAESLLYVNKIYNAVYSLERRRVPAHMPHLIDKSIVNNMQEKFKFEFQKTSSHKVRDSEDMQFAFSYFYFLSSEKRKVPIEEIFDMFDTDKSR